jgi:molybdopterin/thiamine biosynthesis adenylyltransferase
MKSLGAAVLSREEVSVIYPHRSFTAGWRVEVSLGERSSRKFDVLLSLEFPFCPVRIALVDRPNFLTWPHLESDGLICLLPDATPVDFTQALESTQLLLGSAVELILALERGEYLDHFRQEFLTYWAQSGELGTKFYSILKGERLESRLIKSWVGETAVYVGESTSDVSGWLTNRFGSKPQFDRCDAALFLWLGEPLLPCEYPKNSQDMLFLVRRANAEALLRQLCSDSPMRIPVVLGFLTEYGICLAGLMMYTSGAKSKHHRSGPSMGNGFRANRAPALVRVNQFLASMGKVSPSMVERVDHDWVHGRGADTRQSVLKSSNVVIFGCGSLGSQVAHQLSMAGVGHLFLVDPQMLASSNTGRHHLGARFVNKPKATSLASELQADFPHLSIRGFQMEWREFHRVYFDYFNSCSLVISMTGDWNSEAFLNSQHLQSRDRQDVLYGWTEMQACAGQAVLVSAVGGCLACHFDASGNAERQLTRPSGIAQPQEPACGAIFQPYGPVELSSTVGLISGLALNSLLLESKSSVHHMWKGSTVLLEEAGGSWNTELLQEHDAMHHDNVQLRTDWKVNSDCLICGGNER